MTKKNIIAGLEIGHTKVALVVADAKNGEFNILDASWARCLNGIKNGAVVNIDVITEAIIGLIEKFNQKSKRKIDSTFINISGLNIRMEPVNPIITLPQRGYEITQKNIADLIESCKIVFVPLDRHILYLSPLEYIVDGQDGIIEPLGLCGSKLGAKIMLVTAPFNQVQNILKAANYAGLYTEETILTSLANIYSVLDEEEKKKGVLLIDLKSDMTEISVIKNNLLLFFETIPKGQDDVTNEIAVKLDIPLELAEELKLKYGFLDCSQQESRNQSIIPFEWLGKRQNIPRGQLNKIINEQIELIFSPISNKIKDFKGFKNTVQSGAVITGGGASMEGMLEWTTQKLGFTVRQGALKQDGGHLEDIFITPLGLARYGVKKNQEEKTKTNMRFFKKVFQKTSELLNDYF